MILLRNPLIKQWVLFNYLGWLLGIIIGPILYTLVIFPAVWLNDSLDKILAPLFLSFPLGISVGVMQNFVIKQWKLPIFSWILISTLSSITTTIIIMWLFHDNTFGKDMTIIFLAPIFAGFNVGVFQAIFLRKSISKPMLWIISYIGGLFAAVIMVLIITITAFTSADFIIKVLYALELWDIVWNRDLVLTIFNLLTLPIWLALVIGLPTGDILHKKFSNLGTD